jgi:hypothetical protein
MSNTVWSCCTSQILLHKGWRLRIKMVNFALQQLDRKLAAQEACCSLLFVWSLVFQLFL